MNIQTRTKRDHAHHFVFAGGGTAGHLFPGLAVAETLIRNVPLLHVTFAGTGREFERERVLSAGYSYLPLPSRPLPTRAVDAWRFVADNLAARSAATRFLRGLPKALVIGLGGYASLAMTRAAARQGVPFILLEQNAVPGRSNRWMAAKAAMICTAFGEANAHFKAGCSIRVTGNPVRREFLENVDIDDQTPRSGAAEADTLVVLGGSGGSPTLNYHVPRAVYKAGSALQRWHVLHQSGPREAEPTRELYRKLAISATVVPFIDNLPQVLLSASLVVSRAGGSTLSELAICGAPAILVPFPRATDDHQRANAEVLARQGACQLLDEREVRGRFDNALATQLHRYASDARLRSDLARSMLRLARPDAARRVAEAIRETVGLRELASVA